MNRTCSLCLIVLAATACRSDEKLPEPPKGFTWKKIDEIKASVLMPAGWHYRLDKQGKTIGAFITREKIEDGKAFKTGLSINVLRDQKDPSPEKLAKALVENLGKMGKIEDAFKVSLGKFRGSGGRLTVPERNVTGQFLVIANPATNTLYIIHFESPEKEWPEAWKVGKVIMDRLALDDDF